MKIQLHFQKGNRSLKLRSNTLHDKNYVFINCTEVWESDDSDFGEGEYHDACFYLEPDNIDQLIEKLKEAKEFLLLTDHIKKLGD